MGGGDSIGYFREAIAQRTILRNRADVFGLALALTRTRDFVNADRELNSIHASVVVKRPNGYSGDLCSAGSREARRAGAVAAEPFSTMP